MIGRVTIAMLGASTLLVSITPAQTQLSFEAASIRPSLETRMGGGVINPNVGDRFTAVAATAVAMIRFAYDTGISEVVGQPSWAASERFDVTATAGRPATVAEKKAMVRSLLKDRFRLSLHEESKDGDVLELVVKTAGKLGPNMRPAIRQCVAQYEERERNGSTTLPCSPTLAKVDGNFRGSAMTMAQLAAALEPIARNPIIDRTELAGRFEIVLRMDSMAGRRPTASDDPNRPPYVFTALEEQAGLKLQQARGPIRTFVIDSLSRPNLD